MVIGTRQTWAGIVPRLQDGRWNGAGKLSMTYQSLVEIGGTITEIIQIQLRGSEQERDLFTSLRGFQIHSSVTVTGTRQGDIVDVNFGWWVLGVLAAWSISLYSLVLASVTFNIVMVSTSFNKRYAIAYDTSRMHFIALTLWVG